MIPTVVHHRSKSEAEQVQVDLVRILTDMGATSAPSARPWTPRTRLEEQALAQLIRAGVVQEESGGRYWVSESALEMRRATQRPALLLAIAIALLLAGALIGLVVALKR